MAEKQIANSSPGPSPNTLQRGKACLRCRKRKMRCDGAKPACQQCVRAKKAEGCEYDDGKGKTRTQLMREHIARLELRIKELENNENVTPSVTLFDPHAPSPYYSESSSPSSHGSPGNISLSTSTSPAPYSPDEVDIRSTMVSPLAVKYPDMDPTWETRWEQMTNFTTGSHISEAYRTSEEPPVELAQMLLEIFLPHRHQCGLDVHVGRLRESLGLPPTEQRHPVLMNTIYLWACYLSRPESLSEHEPLYLARALSAMSEAIQYPSKVLDVIQASCLLSTYFLSNGRLFEGNYYACAAASLTMQYGLHQIDAESHAGVGMWETTFSLEPEKDTIEHGERILTFWQAYNLDRCWSVALQRPPIIPDSDHPSTCITTSWPQRIEDYESGDLEGSTSNGTIFDFLAHQAQTSTLVGGFSTIAMRAKASVLFEAAHRLSSSFMRQMPASNAMMDDFRVLEHTITRFTTTLLPLHQLGAAMPEDKFTLIVVHSLAHAATIHLHTPFTERDPVSREKCARAARAMILVTKHIADMDFDFLEPIVGPCWLTGAKVLESELIRLQASWPPPNTMEIRAELSGFLFVLTKLSARFPLLGYQAAKVQNSLEGK